jgi:hypothetical protein
MLIGARGEARNYIIHIGYGKAPNLRGIKGLAFRIDRSLMGEERISKHGLTRVRSCKNDLSHCHSPIGPAVRLIYNTSVTTLLTLETPHFTWCIQN